MHSLPLVVFLLILHKCQVLILFMPHVHLLVPRVHDAPRGGLLNVIAQVVQVPQPLKCPRLLGQGISISVEKFVLFAVNFWRCKFWIVEIIKAGLKVAKIY